MSDQDTSPAPKRLDTALAVEIGICVFLIAVFSWMFSHSYEWDIEAGLFPRLISGFGVASVLAYLAQITWQNLKGHAGRAGRILDIPWAKVSGDSGSVKISRPRFISIARWLFTVTFQNGSRRWPGACAWRSSSAFMTSWRKPPGTTRCSLI
jgi:hypothetical protein